MVMAYQKYWVDEMKAWVENEGGVGFASRDYVFENENIEGKVFAIELLTDPLILKKDEKTIIVDINRKNVAYALYTTEAKTKLCEICFKNWKHMTNYAKKVDKEINNFLLGNSEYDEIESETTGK